MYQKKIFYCLADYCLADYRLADYCLADYCLADYCLADYCLADYCLADYCLADYCLAVRRLNFKTKKGILKFQKRTVRFLIKSKKNFFLPNKMNDFDNCECDIFSPREHHYRAKPLDDVTYDAVQLEMLRWQLMKWKKKHTKLLAVIETEKREKEQLSLDVTTWQARFLALSAKFLNLKNVIKELDLWFSVQEENEEEDF